MKRSICEGLVLTLIALVLTGCSTMEGLGQDIQRAGGAIQEAADRDDE